MLHEGHVREMQKGHVSRGVVPMTQRQGRCRRMPQPEIQGGKAAEMHARWRPATAAPPSVGQASKEVARNRAGVASTNSRYKRSRTADDPSLFCSARRFAGPRMDNCYLVLWQATISRT